MPDPIDELENFTHTGLTMNPLPASEVRRRGTRMRRRNNALAAIGGVAVVAIIATPLAMAASNNRTDTTPPPANPSPSPTVTWVTEIPADFPLADGLPNATTSDTYRAQSDADACAGLGWTPARTTAVAQAVQKETEGGWDRTVALYADEIAAREARLGLMARAVECAATTKGRSRSTELLGSDDPDTLVYADQVSDVGDRWTHRVVQVGNALLLDTAFSIGAPAQTQADLIKEKSGTAVDAMCVFSADPC